MTPDAPYTLDDLVEATGFSKRQIRFYITKRLVAGAGDRGPNATYSDATLRRLQAIAVLKDTPVAPTGRRMTLAEIGHALDSLDADGLAALGEGLAGVALVDTEQVRRPHDPDDSDRYVFKEPANDWGTDDEPSPSTAADYLRSLNDLKAADRRAPEPSTTVESSRSPFDEFASPAFMASLDSAHDLPLSHPEGGEDQHTLTSLLNQLQATLAELGSDTRFTVTAQAGAQWLRIASPDVEFHIRQPDDHRARQRLSELAHELGRLLAREE